MTEIVGVNAIEMAGLAAIERALRLQRLWPNIDFEMARSTNPGGIGMNSFLSDPFDLSSRQDASHDGAFTKERVESTWFFYDNATRKYYEPTQFMQS